MTLTNLIMLNRLMKSTIFFTKFVLVESSVPLWQFSKFFVEKPPEDLLMEMPTDEDEYNILVAQLYLSMRYNSAYEDLSIEDLQQIASEIQLSYTEDEIDFIETKTRDQSACKLWYRFRTGRVTASLFKRVCRTSVESPSMPLIEKICYPERSIFKSQQTDYGLRNESIARNSYAEGIRLCHTNFNIKETGLIINNNYPFCGASPDAMVSCDCCGKGTVEIKSPWVLRNGNFDSYLKRSTCPLVVVGDADNWRYALKGDHEYYYQVQMQIFVTNSEYCDFVVWQPPKKAMNPMTVTRVFKDEPFWLKTYVIGLL